MMEFMTIECLPDTNIWFRGIDEDGRFRSLLLHIVKERHESPVTADIFVCYEDAKGSGPRHTNCLCQIECGRDIESSKFPQSLGFSCKVVSVVIDKGCSDHK